MAPDWTGLFGNVRCENAEEFSGRAGFVRTDATKAGLFYGCDRSGRTECVVQILNRIAELHTGTRNCTGFFGELNRASVANY